jgi:hypothetical protein
MEGKKDGRGGEVGKRRGEGKREKGKKEKRKGEGKGRQAGELAPKHKSLTPPMIIIISTLYIKSQVICESTSLSAKNGTDTDVLINGKKN